MDPAPNTLNEKTSLKRTYLYVSTSDFRYLFIFVFSKQVTLPSLLSLLIIVFRIFRTMGLRHLTIVDGDLQVVGMITRFDLNEHRLAHYWEEQVSFISS